ncbi:OmpH family outer membrane protein [Flavobacterium salilacus subsp. salilacus]|uniref:OmpH family outer membrane protein n=1 Tax=Flavobacterium TaxID=237 RepID=UPI001074DF39|nr:MULTISPECIES: OmpH family outer membrane protein [Flavobacterium]KAF2519025.1 OmpH family outer membrane protein [Flavobacterium salilacus subsp. salilacus]MBE1614812.1 OmpH family outer membrane protein [Flavobacterium sp. SaA2.13]
MRRSLLILALALTLFSCDKNQTSSNGLKTAYIDTVKLMEGYDELKDLESKGKVKSEEMARELDGEAQKLRLDAASFQNEAQSKGRQWAELKMQELQNRERELGVKQETMMRQLQEEFGVKRDTILSQMKKHIKEYGKKEGYDYIYGTGDAASILYGKEAYDITDVILKDLNDNYKGENSTTEKPEAKEEDTITEAK